MRLVEAVDEARPLTRQDRRDEDEQLVDEAGAEEGSRERRATFQEERLHALVGERAQLVLERARAKLELGTFGQRAAAEGEPPRLPHDRDVPRIEPRVLEPHRPHADGDGVRAGAQLVDEAARLLARDPALAWHRDPSVQGHGDLVGHERTAAPPPTCARPRSGGAPRRGRRARPRRRPRGASPARPPPRGSDRARPRPHALRLQRRSRPRKAASSRGERRAPSSRRASRREPAPPPARARRSRRAGRPPRSPPSPTISPSRTTTAPTVGFGYARPRAASASSSARSRLTRGSRAGGRPPPRRARRRCRCRRR